MSLWFRESYFPDVGNASEIARDWAKQPLVSITVTSDEECPDGHEAIFYRPWLGTDIYCICDAKDKGMATRHMLGECTGFFSNAQNGDKYDCYHLPPINPVLQTSFEGVRVCGVRGGLAFHEAVRPRPEDGKCPEGTEPCLGEKSSPENTLCYPPEDLDSDCPITHIDVVSDSESATYAANGYRTALLSSGQSVVYSTQRDSLPVTSIKIENQPCV